MRVLGGCAAAAAAAEVVSQVKAEGSSIVAMAVWRVVWEG